MWGYRERKPYGLGFKEYMRQANEELVIVVQVEHIEGVKNIEAIAGVPGIDAILIGPYDLSGSLGMPGQVTQPEVQMAIREVRKGCELAGIAAGIFAADGESARGYVEEGYSLIAVGLDSLFLWGAAKKALEQVRGE